MQAIHVIMRCISKIEENVTRSCDFQIPPLTCHCVGHLLFIAGVILLPFFSLFVCLLTSFLLLLFISLFFFYFRPQPCDQTAVSNGFCFTNDPSSYRNDLELELIKNT